MNKAFKKFDEFRNQNGSDNFKSRELAQEFSKLKKDWWGSNLVVLEVKENENGTFSPSFNVWD